MTFLRWLSLWLLMLVSFSASAGRPNMACIKNGNKVYSKFTPINTTGKRVGKMVEIQDFFGKVSMIKRSEILMGRKCLLVVVQKSRMRDGPGSNYKPKDLAFRGEGYLDLGGEDGWTRVENSNGKSMWINLDHTWSPAPRQMRMSFQSEK